MDDMTPGAGSSPGAVSSLLGLGLPYLPTPPPPSSSLFPLQIAPSTRLSSGSEPCTTPLMCHHVAYRLIVPGPKQGGWEVQDCASPEVDWRC